MDSCYLFNPDHDMALANFTPYYKCSKEIEKMADDLSFLPAWYAGEGGGIHTSAEERVELFLQQSQVAKLIPDFQWTTAWLDLPYHPWGWNPALVSELRKQGVRASLLPAPETLSDIRELGSRRQGMDVLSVCRQVDGTGGEAFLCTSLAEVQRWLKKHGCLMLKAPWSGSGRGLVRIDEDSWSPSVEGWLLRLFRTQGFVMAEPFYLKVADFAMEFEMTADSSVRFLGYSLFETDAHGNYKGNRLAANEWILSYLTQWVSAISLCKVQEALMRALSAVLRGKYQGFLGVDMMICQTDGRYWIHPCVEINLRMNMGIVARILADRYLPAGRQGRMLLEYYPRKEEALAMHEKLQAALPALISCHQLVGGYLPLTPVTADTRYQAYILMDEESVGADLNSR